MYFPVRGFPGGSCRPARAITLPLWSEIGKIILPSKRSYIEPDFETKIRPAFSISLTLYFFFFIKKLDKTFDLPGA